VRDGGTDYGLKTPPDSWEVRVIAVVGGAVVGLAVGGPVAVVGGAVLGWVMSATHKEAPESGDGRPTEASNQGGVEGA
jgi:hypothetical protein